MNLQESIRRILMEEFTEDKNLYGKKLKPCSTKPMTGYYRDGYCRTGNDDTGSHTVCARVTEEFLEFTKSMGNNLDMLEPNDKWCLCAKRWEEANKEGVAPKMIKSSTNIKTLDIIDNDEQELGEYARTLKNARRQGYGLRFSKSAIKANPQRFRKYSRDDINESDPKTGTGKKPEGSGRRLYTDENPNDTVSVKFRTKQDIVDTLNKSSFKSKPHKRQSQIINLIHQRVRAAYQNAKDPETKQRLKRAYDYIETVKEKSKQKTIRLQKQKVNESNTSEYNELIYIILEQFKKKDCICDIRVSFDVEDNYYNVYLVFSQEELHDKFSDVMGMRNHITEMMNEVKMELKAFLPIVNIFIGYYSKPNCKWSPLNESEDKNQSLLSLIDKHGLYEFMKMTGLSLPQIYTKTEELPREIFERFIKDFIDEQGYHQTNGAVQMGYGVEISHNIYINHFHMKGDKVTLEITGYDNGGKITDAYIESLSNLSDNEIFNIVDNMIGNIEDIWY